MCVFLFVCFGISISSSGTAELKPIYLLISIQSGIKARQLHQQRPELSEPTERFCTYQGFVLRVHLSFHPLFSEDPSLDKLAGWLAGLLRASSDEKRAARRYFFGSLQVPK